MTKKRSKTEGNYTSDSYLRDEDIDSSSTRSNSRNRNNNRTNHTNKHEKNKKTKDLNDFEYVDEDSDALLDSDEGEGELNRSGNVPIDWYDNEDHIGYTLEGQKLIKELDSTQLGQLIFNSENPDAWRTIIDPRNNRKIRLSDEDLKIIRRIRKGMYPSETYDAEGLTVEFDNENSKQPVSFELPPKARFLPSKWEAIRVAKLVKLIKEGKILTTEQRRLNEEKKLQELEKIEDIWKDAIYDVDPTSAKRSAKHEIKPPKIALPTHSESYNPPEEYLFNEEETKNWMETEPHERDTNYLPTKYSSLRVVPVYANLIVERFNRCLQLLLCPRAVKLKMNVDPESLLPKLPSPSELGPYPKNISVEYRFKGVKKVSLDYSGRYLALSTVDAVNVCDVITGFCVLKLEFKEVHCVLWHTKLPVLLVSHEKYVTLLALDLPNKSSSSDNQSDDNKENNNNDKENEYEKAKKYLHMETGKGAWKPYTKDKYEGITIQHTHPVKNMSIHHGGNYVVCVSPDSVESVNQCVLHCLPKKTSMRVGNKVSNNSIKLAVFHPNEPKLIVAFTRNIRVYNLSTSGTTKDNNKLADESKFTGVELPTSLDTNGTYLLCGDEQGKLTMYDQEISTFPYKSFSFENESVVKVQLHKKLPLVVVGYKKSVKCFHLSTNDDGEALFVPLNEMKIEGKLTDCTWHNTEPWLFTSSDKEALMWA